MTTQNPLKKQRIGQIVDCFKKNVKQNDQYCENHALEAIILVVSLGLYSKMTNGEGPLVIFTFYSLNVSKAVLQ